MHSDVLPDSYIGAHAEVDGLAILTRNVRRYRTYFPTVSLNAPPRRCIPGNEPRQPRLAS